MDAAGVILVGCDLGLELFGTFLVGGDDSEEALELARYEGYSEGKEKGYCF